MSLTHIALAADTASIELKFDPTPPDTSVNPGRFSHRVYATNRESVASARVVNDEARSARTLYSNRVIYQLRGNNSSDYVNSSFCSDIPSIAPSGFESTASQVSVQKHQDQLWKGKTPLPEGHVFELTIRNFDTSSTEYTSLKLMQINGECAYYASPSSSDSWGRETVTIRFFLGHGSTSDSPLPLLTVQPLIHRDPILTLVNRWVLVRMTQLPFNSKPYELPVWQELRSILRHSHLRVNHHHAY